MSVEAIAIALHHSRARKATTIAVLIGIANHDGDGGAWPTIATLAHYARIQDRAVQRCITELIELGEVRRDIQSGGTVEIAHYDRPNLYHFTLKCPPHCDRSTAHKLICQTCGKPLPKSYQTTFQHPRCAQADRVSPETPGVPRDTRGVSPRPPKTYLETTTNDSEETYVGNRAPEMKNDASGAPSRDVFDIVASAAALHAPERGEPDDPCPHWRGRVPHSFAPSTGECIDCGALDPARINQETGEVA